MQDFENDYYETSDDGDVNVDSSDEIDVGDTSVADISETDVSIVDEADVGDSTATDSAETGIVSTNDSADIGAANESESRSLHDDLNNPDLFNDNKQGEYSYGETEYGKTASGSLELQKGERDAAAQRSVGGEDRTARDDGGHFIGARFNGAPGEENLEAQDRGVNRGSYKQRENSWAKSLEEGDKVFVNTESYHSNGSERPDAFMGYTVTEHPDGTREWDAFSYQNEDPAVQAAQNAEVAAQNDLIDEYDNAMEYPDDYDPAEYYDDPDASNASSSTETSDTSVSDAASDSSESDSSSDTSSGEGDE